MKIKKNRQFYFMLYLFFFLIALYAGLDFITNKNTTGIAGLDRKSVHLSLFFIITFLGTYHVYTIMCGKLLLLPVSLVLWLITGWIFVVNFVQNINLWSGAVQLGLSMLWVFTYYFFCFYTYKNPDCRKKILFFMLVMFSFYLFSVVYGAYNINQRYGVYAVVNLAYAVVVFLPWHTLLSSNKKCYFGLILTVLAVFLSLKRGAILVLPVMFCVYYIFDGINNNRLFKNTCISLSFFMLFASGLVLVDFSTHGYLNSRFSFEQLIDGSGRFEMYQRLIGDLSNSTVCDLIVGRGSGAVEEILGMAAHNECLQFIYNFGLIGVSLYFLLFVVLIYRLWRLVKLKSHFSSGYAMAVIYMLVVGLFGQIYFAHSTFYIMAFLGVVDGLTVNESRRLYGRKSYSKNLTDQELLASVCN